MKRALIKIVLLSALLSLTACNTPKKSSVSQSEDSVIVSHSDIPTSSKVSSSSSKQSSSSKSSSINQTSSGLKDNELSTASGLNIKFKAQGARIDKITWGANKKQIAKDGFTVGRCANRIAGGKCTIDGKLDNLTINNNGNHLHGGGSSWQGPFATKNWTKVEQTESSITFSIHSADGEEGYPGNMDMTVKYTLSEAGELTIEYTATSDKTTLCNPTNHLFMAPNGNTSYNDIKLWIDADSYTPLKNSIPTGEIATVAGTQFDYRSEKTFDGSKNYDDNLVLNGTGYRKVATMKGMSLGLQIDVYTDRPGLQLYKDGSGSICLETQMFPDAINQPNFEDPLLEPGQTFYSKTTYAFSEIA